MIERIQIVGARGRVGSAVSARLAERGIELASENPELVLLCVPDRAIGEVAAGTPVGPWIAHVSGATPLDALEPHVLPLRAASAAVVLEGGRRRAARRRLGRCHRGERRRARRRLVARGDARTPAVRARRRRTGRLPRRSGDGVELPRDPAGRRSVAARSGRRAARGARPAHPRRGGLGLRAHRPDRARRLGDGRAPPRSHPRRAPGARGAVPRPRRGDRPHRRPRAASWNRVLEGGTT